jgi:hypothetical protein
LDADWKDEEADGIGRVVNGRQTGALRHALRIAQTSLLGALPGTAIKVTMGSE